MSGIKIKLVTIDGQERVPPECMRILTELAAHRDLCECCTAAHKTGSANWCLTGQSYIQELSEQPEVEPA